MRITVYMENSEGVEVKVFDERVRTSEECDLVHAITKWAVSTEILIKKYVESLGEDP